MLKFQLWSTKFILEHLPDEEIKVEASVAMVKDLLVENLDGHGILLL